MKPVVEPPQAWNRLQPGGYGPGSSARRPSDAAGRLRSRLLTSAGRPRGKPAAYPWRGCRGKAGHRTPSTGHGERGNHLGVALPVGQPGRRRAGPSSADGPEMGRRPRSSPRPGKPATWRRERSESAVEVLECQEVAGEYRRIRGRRLDEAEARVLGIQTKLHQWATDSPDRRFDDLFNLVCDPAFLLVAWASGAGQSGARTAGVDGVKPRSHRRRRGSVPRRAAS